ncbi:hypothetical protein FACS1894190_18200 [Spirochaetia bacterium]|nr:hypothetical protein FACS1894190_18200 [Spirochaetia bacterium]
MKLFRKYKNIRERIHKYEYYTTLASASISIDDNDKAVENYTKSIREKFNVAESYFFRAIAYYQKDNWNKALSDLNESLRLDSSNYNAVNLKNKINTDGTAPAYHFSGSQVSKNYSGKYIALTGNVNSIGIDHGSATLGGAAIGGLLFGPLGLLLGAGLGADSSNDPLVASISGVNCYFNENRKNEFSSLRKDQNITIIGRCNEYGSLTNCRIYQSMNFNFTW